MQKILLWFIVFIFAMQAIASWQLWYVAYPWFDIPMHMLGGAWLGLLFFYLFEERHKVMPPGSSGFLRVFASLGFVALIGIGWELFEYWNGAFLAQQFPWGGGRGEYYFDSLLDLVDDLIGGLAAALWYAKHSPKP